MNQQRISNEYKRRILQAIAECDSYINKEEPRGEYNRPATVAQILAETKAHKAKLLRVLDADDLSLLHAA